MSPRVFFFSHHKQLSTGIRSAEADFRLAVFRFSSAPSFSVHLQGTREIKILGSTVVVPFCHLLPRSDSNMELHSSG